MISKYLICVKSEKPKMKRQNTPYPKQSIINLENGTIEQKQIKSSNSDVGYEYLPNSGILHIFKKTENLSI